MGGLCSAPVDNSVIEELVTFNDMTKGLDVYAQNSAGKLLQLQNITGKLEIHLTPEHHWKRRSLAL